MFLLSAKPLITDKGAEMTRKDYEMIAKAIGWTIEHTERTMPEYGTESLYVFTGAISEMLKAENPRFDVQRFNDAVQKYAVA
jgi:hypothetical protein